MRLTGWPLCLSGVWNFLESANMSSRFPDFKRSDGNSVIELMSTPTKITGVHYVQVKIRPGYFFLVSNSKDWFKKHIDICEHFSNQSFQRYSQTF